MEHIALEKCDLCEAVQLVEYFGILTPVQFLQGRLTTFHSLRRQVRWI